MAFQKKEKVETASELKVEGWPEDKLEPKRIRGFEVIEQYKHYPDPNNKEVFETSIKLPERKTAESAGYDFCASEDVYIYPGTLVKIPTGVKAYMPANEYLDFRIRSGLAIKNNLILINSCGVVDADYYNNPDNEGHIMAAIFNVGKFGVPIKKGDRIAQGIFTEYKVVDNDTAKGVRVGGWGSTGK